MRVEQLYPWAERRHRARARAASRKREHVVWVQEEPSEHGPVVLRARPARRPRCRRGARLRYAGRREAAAPAGGSMRLHKQRQGKLLFDAFTD